MKNLTLTMGVTALVDDDDYESVSTYTWYYNPGGYAQRKENGLSILLHRSITNAPAGVFVDHINHNGLDCRKENLRLCTHAQNMANRTKSKNTSSKYKGVCKSRGKYQANICANGIAKNLGTFVSEVNAALAYDKAARKSFGEFAKPNFQLRPDGSAIIW